MRSRVFSQKKRTIQLDHFMETIFGQPGSYLVIPLNFKTYLACILTSLPLWLLHSMQDLGDEVVLSIEEWGNPSYCVHGKISNSNRHVYSFSIIMKLFIVYHYNDGSRSQFMEFGCPILAVSSIIVGNLGPCSMNPNT